MSTARTFLPGARPFDSVQVGDALPTLTKQVTTLTNFLFGVSFWTAHRIHYDQQLARDEGFDGPVILGALMSAYVARDVAEWAGDPMCLRRVTSRNTAGEVTGATLEITGTVASLEPADHTVTCELTVTSGPTVVMTATVVVELPVRA